MSEGNVGEGEGAGSEGAGAGGEQGGGGGQQGGGEQHVSGWKGSLPEGMQNQEFLQGFSNDSDGLTEFTTRSLEDQQYIRRKGHPEPNWGEPEQVSKFYGEMGRPESAAGYDVSKVEVPKGLEGRVDEKFTNALMNMAWEEGVTQRQMPGLYQKFLQITEAVDEGTEQARLHKRDEAEATLRKDWGLAFDGNVNIAKQAMASSLGVDKVPQDILDRPTTDGGTWGSDPTMIRMWHSIGSRMSEGSLGGPKQGGVGPLTPSDAGDKMKRFELENRAVILDAQHPEHQWAIDQRAALRRAMHPEGSE
jgi:hypothetical protein